MSDYLITLLVMIGVGLFFLVPAAYFGGKVGVVITTVILIFISCYLYLYGIAIGKSFSNSHSSVVLDTDMILQFLSFTALFAFIAYGAFCFSKIAHGIGGFKIKLVIWGAVLIGYPMYIAISNLYNLHQKQRKHYSNTIVITHAKDFPILIDRIKFFDSKTKKASSIRYRFYENYNKVSEIEGLSYKGKSMSSQRYYTTSGHTLIPIKFDSFELSWYSVLENKFYKDKFSIDSQKLRVREDSKKQLIINDMLIHILPNGHVDLLKKEYQDYSSLVTYFDVAFSVVEGQTLEAIFKSHSQITLLDANSIERLHKDFKILENGTGTKLSPKEILNFRNVYSFGIDIEINQEFKEENEIKEVEVVDFYLNRYTRSVDFFKGINSKPLPGFMRLKVLNSKGGMRWLDIMFDKKSLFHQYVTFVESHKDEVFFDIKVNIGDLTKSEIYLKSKNEKIILNNWIISDDQ